MWKSLFNWTPGLRIANLVLVPALAYWGDSAASWILPVLLFVLFSTPLLLGPVMVVLVFSGLVLWAFEDPESLSYHTAFVCMFLCMTGMCVDILKERAPLGIDRCPMWSRAILVWVALIGGIGFSVAALIRGVPIDMAVGWAGLYWLAWNGLKKSLPTKSDPDRRPLLTTVLCVVAILFSLGVVELGARLVLPPPEAGNLSIFVHHERRLYAPSRLLDVKLDIEEDDGSMVPFHIQTSSIGFRDAEVGEKAANEKRVLMLGDSFAFGWGLAQEESIPAVLDRAVRDARAGGPLRVINGGVSGYGPKQQLDLLEEVGFGLEPDLVILQTFPNDIMDSAVMQGRLLEAYTDFDKKRAKYASVQDVWQVKLQHALQTRTYVGPYIFRVVGWDLPLLNAFNRVRFIPPRPFPEFPPSAERTAVLEVNLKEWYPDLTFAWEQFQRNVLALRDACAKRDVEFLAYYIPTEHYFDQAFWDETVGDEDAELYEHGKGVALVEGFFAESEIAFVPVRESIDSQPDIRAVYFRRDGHLRALGAKAVAEQLSEALRARDW
jgi:hypothetical protein